MRAMISIICTVKNGESTIRETLESIINQTYSDWELIIVDDGSIDNTVSIINEFTVRDKRIKSIVTKGVGRSKALNIAIENSAGSHIANVDIDDPIHPRRLELQLKYFEDHEQVDLLCTDIEILIGRESPTWGDLPYIQQEFKLLNNLLPYKNPISHSSVMFKEEVVKELQGYSEELKALVDYDLWIKAASAGFTIAHIPIKLSSKRIHDKQSFENKKRLQYLVNAFKVQKQAIKKLDSSVLAYIFLYGKFIYGLFPQRLRMILKK